LVFRSPWLTPGTLICAQVVDSTHPADLLSARCCLGSLSRQVFRSYSIGLRCALLAKQSLA
jgi:hypothetical protein